MTKPTTPLADLNEETRKIWDQNAAYWDDRMADGNDFQRTLIGPATERLLDLHPGEEILEVACGNGVMARRLADLGARVTASDFSADMIDRARARSRALGEAIDFRVADATDARQLLSMGEGRFDGAVCNMAIMDMAEIDPLMTAMPRLLKPGGRFVFSLCHPCFNHSGMSMVMEEHDDGEIHDLYSIKVSRYLNLGVQRGLAMIGQPVPQLYFNRTLSTLFNACFRAGMVIDGLEEPAFEEGGEPARRMSWVMFTEIPPVLVARVRPGRVKG